ncbi:MAG: ABC transporter ATP-binding protein [Geminicoccaceae bacterium]
MSAATVLDTALPAIRCHGVTKEFRSAAGVTPVLHGIDLDLPAGELALLVGPSGCGKTTLISILAGILSPTAGTIEVLGASLWSMSDRQRTAWRRRHVGFVFQAYNLLPALTAAENAALPLVTQGRRLGEAARTVLPLLERLGLASHAQKLPAQLSGGQQQRVAIARALAHAPDLVVCDEPTAALDAGSGRAVIELLREVAVAPGRAVLVVTHDSRIYPYADRIAAMEDGRVVAVRTGPGNDQEIHP